MKLKVLKYNRNKARRLFPLLKFLELFAVFLFVVGFHGLGSLIYNHFPKFYAELFGLAPVNCFTLWAVGLCIFVMGIVVLAMVVGTIWVAYLIFQAWFRANWRWAQTLSENKKVKVERLKEQKKFKEIKRIEKLEKQRKKFGYCVGDTAVMIKDGNHERAGTKFKIVRVGLDGYIDCKVNGKKYDGCPRRKFTFIKNKIPKKPELSLLRQKEVNRWKK